MSVSPAIQITPRGIGDYKINGSGVVVSGSNNSIRYLKVNSGDELIITITHTASKTVTCAMFASAPASGSTAIEGTLKNFTTTAGDFDVHYVAAYDGFFAFSMYDSGSYILRIANNNAIAAKNIVPWIYGKKVSIMGNSRCTFSGYLTPSTNNTKYPDNDVKTVTQTWWWKVINSLGATLEVNNSYSGGRVTTTIAGSYCTLYDNNGIGNPDVVFLWGGINDLRNSVELGSLDFTVATSNLDKTKFAPALDYLVRRIISDHPNAYIVLFVEDCLSFNQDWVQVIYDIANHYCVPRWEVGSTNGGGVIGVVDLSNLMSEAKRYDSLHYNAEGMQTIASQTLTKLATMGSENVNDRLGFNAVGMLDKVAQFTCQSEIKSTYTYTSGTITKSASYTQAFISHNFVKGRRYRVTVDFGTLVVSVSNSIALRLRLSDRNVTSDSYRIRQTLRNFTPLEMVTTVIEFTANESIPYLEYYLYQVTTQGSGTLTITINELGSVTAPLDNQAIVTEDLEIARNFDAWDAAGTWQLAKGTRGFVFPIRAYNTEVVIAAGESACYYAFWKEYPTPANSGAIGCYCDGCSRSSVSANRTKAITVPSDCKYVYIGMVNKDGNAYTPVSVSLRYAARDFVEREEETRGNNMFPYKYKGGYLNLNCFALENKNSGDLVFLSDIGAYSAKSQQSIAIYNDYIFSFYDTGYVRIYHLSSKTLLASFQMANTISGANNHCGNANFGKQFYNAGDVFPCLYLSSYEERKAYVLRIIPTGTDANGNYTFDATSISLIQSINGNSTWAYHFYPDNDKLLVHKNDGSLNQHYYVFDIPLVTAGDVTLDASNALDEFTYNIGLTQAGAISRNGMIFANMYSVWSGHDAKRAVYVYDYINHNGHSLIPAPLYAMRSYEVEGIEIFDGAIWLSHNGGNFLSKIEIG